MSLTKFFALWEGQSRDGKKLLKGKLGDLNILIMPNGYRKSDKHPSHIAFLTEPEKREPSSGGGGGNDPLPF